MWCTGIGFNPGSDRMKCRTVHHNGDLGVENTMSATVAYGSAFEAVRISDTRTVVHWRQLSNTNWMLDQGVLRVLDWTGSGTTRTFTGGSDLSGMGVSVGFQSGLAYVSSTDKLVLNNWVSGEQRVRVGTVSGSAGSGTITWGTVGVVATGSFGSLTYDATNDKLVCIWKNGPTNTTEPLWAAVIQTSASDNEVSIGTASSSGFSQTPDGSNSACVTAEGLFVRGIINNLAGYLKCLTVDGFNINWQGGSTLMTANSNNGSTHRVDASC